MQHTFAEHGARFLPTVRLWAQAQRLRAALHREAENACGRSRFDRCRREYQGYAADITRTFPVSGEFSPEQRAIHDLF